MHNENTSYFADEFADEFLAIFEECQFIFGSDCSRKALGYIGEITDKHTNKILNYLVIKISLEQLKKVKDRIHTLEFAPNLAKIIRLATYKEKLNYADLFQKISNEYSIFNSMRNCIDMPIDAFKTHDIRLFNIALQMQGKGLNVLNLVYEQCKESFKQIVDRVYEMPEAQLEPIPQPALALERKRTEEERQIAKKYLKQMKEGLKTKIIPFPNKKASGE